MMKSVKKTTKYYGIAVPDRLNTYFKILLGSLFVFLIPLTPGAQIIIQPTISFEAELMEDFEKVKSEYDAWKKESDEVILMTVIYSIKNQITTTFSEFDPCRKVVVIITVSNEKPEIQAIDVFNTPVRISQKLPAYGKILNIDFWTQERGSVVTSKNQSTLVAETRINPGADCSSQVLRDAHARFEVACKLLLEKLKTILPPQNLSLEIQIDHQAKSLQYQKKVQLLTDEMKRCLAEKDNLSARARADDVKVLSLSSELDFQKKNYEEKIQKTKKLKYPGHFHIAWKDANAPWRWREEPCQYLLLEEDPSSLGFHWVPVSDEEYNKLPNPMKIRISPAYIKDESEISRLSSERDQKLEKVSAEIQNARKSSESLQKQADNFLCENISSQLRSLIDERTDFEEKYQENNKNLSKALETYNQCLKYLEYLHWQETNIYNLCKISGPNSAYTRTAVESYIRSYDQMIRDPIMTDAITGAQYPQDPIRRWTTSQGKNN